MFFSSSLQSLDLILDERQDRIYTNNVAPPNNHSYWITLIILEIICWSPSVRVCVTTANINKRYLSLFSVRDVTANFRPIFLSISVISKWALFEIDMLCELRNSC
jgi:hypothetical protein